MSAIIPDLNQEQNQAIAESFQHSSTLVLSGPGSGKTRLITYRIAHLLNHLHVDPANILAVTFTNRAASEMKTRIEKLVQTTIPKNTLWVSTFHAMGARILRRYGPHGGLDQNFNILDADDSRAVVYNILVSRQGQPIEKQILRQESRRMYERICDFKRMLDTPDVVLARAQTHDELLAGEIYREYQEQLARSSGVDFSDLQLRTIRLLNDHQAIREYYQDKFRYIMVDEFQDINLMQHTLLRLLISPHLNFCAVGDADQSLYGFRGSLPDYLLSFENHFPDAHIARLEQCYRCPGKIVTAANTVIGHNEKRPEKVIWTENDDGESIHLFVAPNEYREADLVARLANACHRRGTDYDQIAVMARTNQQLNLIGDAMKVYGLPYQQMGRDPLWDSREVCDMIAMIKLAASVETSLGYRRFLLLLPGVGSVTVDDITQWVQKEGISWSQAITTFKARQKRTREGLAQAFTMLEDLRDKLKQGRPGDIMAAWIKDHRYFELISCRKEDIIRRRQNLEAFFHYLNEIHDELREDPQKHLDPLLLLDHLQFSGKSSEDGPVGIQLLTIHAAKGLEYDIVFVPGCEEGLLPHAAAHEDAAIEEERRIFYVAITRAKKEVMLTFAAERTIRGRLEERLASRFVKEIPRQLRRDLALKEESA